MRSHRLTRFLHSCPPLQDASSRAQQLQNPASNSPALTPTTTKSAREALLRKIYAPALQVPKHSLAYYRLSQSGALWKQWHRPEDTSPYLALQRSSESFQRQLREIDELRGLVKTPLVELAKNEAVRYAWQSCALEMNPLSLEDAIAIDRRIEDAVFKGMKFRETSAQQLRDLRLPSPRKLLREKEEAYTPAQIAEVRNHIVVSRWVAERSTSPLFSHTAGLEDAEIRALLTILLEDTPSVRLYTYGWGPHLPVGEYRQYPIRVRSNALRVFPYHTEVPSLMSQFFRFRDSQHARSAHQSSPGAQHPLLLACHLKVYFLSVHPFPDGNGRAGRTLLQDYLLRQGYALPAIMKGAGMERRGEYCLRMVSEAEDHRPERLVGEVVAAVLGLLKEARAGGASMQKGLMR